MQSLLVKMFGTALALSQITTAPDAVKTQFDRVQDQQQVAQILRMRANSPTFQELGGGALFFTTTE
jgi:hypothetical protein